jgi:hypothetical protein
VGGGDSCEIDVLVVVNNCVVFFCEIRIYIHIGEVISLCPASNTASGPDPIQVIVLVLVFILPKPFYFLDDESVCRSINSFHLDH